MADDAPRYKEGIDVNPYSPGYGFPQPSAAAAAAPRDLAVSPDLLVPIVPPSSLAAPPAAAVSPSVGAGNAASREGTIRFWMQQGAPAHVAAGIADRVNAESGFRPAVMGDQGTSGGLYQHHADRLARLKAFAAQQGRMWTDPLVQHQFALSEVKGGDAIAAKAWQQILSAPDQQTAAMLWDRYFERSKYGPGAGGRRMVGRFGGMGSMVGTPAASNLATALGPQTAPAAAAPPAAVPAPPESSAPAQLAAPAAAPQRSPLRFTPGAIPQTPDLTAGYNEALASILSGRRRPMGSIFG